MSKSAPVFSDGCIERQQKEAEEKIANLSRYYTGYENVYKLFAAELEFAFDLLEKEKLATSDLEYLSAMAIALVRETVLKHRKFQ